MQHVEHVEHMEHMEHAYVSQSRADRESVKMFDFYCHRVSPCCVFITNCGQMCVGVSTDKGELYLFPTLKNKPNIS